ncbi:MAG: type IV pilus secretin PilQ, partial [Gammaproteobacteria bacterium]|nr:type IV pilus secretin PilQ [Gammaproteobacteria bacterium]
VTVRDDFDRDFGITAGFAYLDEYGSDGRFGITGNRSAASGLVQNGTTPDSASNTAISTPIEGTPAGSIGFAILDSDFLIDLELQALEVEGRGEIISTPRVITANQKEARIKQGVEIPFQEAASSGATSTSFKEAVLELVVTPQITPDNRVIMDLTVTQDTLGAPVPTSGGGTAPAIDTREIDTQVLVDDGATVVLGGIFETTQGEDFTKVPILADIPVIGAAFRGSSREDKKTELLIFVTPRILKDIDEIN